MRDTLSRFDKAITPPMYHLYRAPYIPAERINGKGRFETPTYVRSYAQYDAAKRASRRIAERTIIMDDFDHTLQQGRDPFAAE